MVTGSDVISESYCLRLPFLICKMNKMPLRMIALNPNINISHSSGTIIVVSGYF